MFAYASLNALNVSFLEDPSHLDPHAGLSPWMQDAVLADPWKVLQVSFEFFEATSKQKMMVYL